MSTAHLAYRQGSQTVALRPEWNLNPIVWLDFGEILSHDPEFIVARSD